MTINKIFQQFKAHTLTAQQAVIALQSLGHSYNMALAILDRAE